MTTGALIYDFHVQGHLDDHWARRLGDLTVSRNHDGTSTLTGPVTDQAHLHGLLAGIRDIGAQLVSLHPHETVPGPDESDDRPILESTLKRPTHTERLTLRPARPEDADPTWLYRRLPSVSEWVTEMPTDLDAYRATFTASKRLATTVVVELGGQLIGDFMLRVEDAWAQAEVADQARHAEAELGWVLDPAFSSHGYATEAVRGLLRVCFESLGVRRVVASCFLDNAASWRLMERVGMRRESHAVADSLHRTGGWLDTVAYALLAEEWSDT